MNNYNEINDIVNFLFSSKVIIDVESHNYNKFVFGE
jgi:hypothetical protein